MNVGVFEHTPTTRLAGVEEVEAFTAKLRPNSTLQSLNTNIACIPQRTKQQHHAQTQRLRFEIRQTGLETTPYETQRFHSETLAISCHPHIFQHTHSKQRGTTQQTNTVSVAAADQQRSLHKGRQRGSGNTQRRQPAHRHPTPSNQLHTCPYNYSPTVPRETS